MWPKMNLTSFSWTRLKQESLANAKVSARQLCTSKRIKTWNRHSRSFTLLSVIGRLQSLLSQELVKLRTSNLAGYTFIGSIRAKAHYKFLEKKERGRIQGLSRYFCVPPIISGTGKATNFKFGRNIHRAHPNKRPLKIVEKKERGRIQGLPKFFGYPLLSQEQVKVCTSNFVRTFIGSIGTKAHYKFCEK